MGSFLVLLVAVGSAAAQQPSPRDPDAFLNQQRQVQQELQREFDEKLGFAADGAFDWGGWFSSHVFLFDDGVESSRTLRRFDLRVWGSLSLDDGAHTFYARGRASFIDFNTGDSYDGDDNDFEGMNLERGFYRFDLNRLRASQNLSPADVNLQIEAGRNLVELGTGLAVSLPLDHVSVTTQLDDFDITALAGRTVGSMDDIDITRPIDRTRRTFLGTQIRGTSGERHRPFAYAVWQRDHSDEVYPTFFQEYDYDSFYAGIGSVGQLGERTRYVAELVYEAGSSYGDGQFRQANEVDAWAARVGIERLGNDRYLSRASVEYLFASGDGDRYASPTDAMGGNFGDFRDTGFVGFGFVDTGLAVAPTLSNLHIVRAGASFFPAPDDVRFSELELGTDWYVFHKHHRDGAISDPTANRGSGYAGFEMDYFANWRVDPDLAVTLRFGAFFPGDAYSDRSPRTFLLAGVTWSF